MQAFFEGKVKLVNDYLSYEKDDKVRKFVVRVGNLAAELDQDTARIPIYENKQEYVVAIDLDNHFNVLRQRNLTLLCHQEYRNKINSKGYGEIKVGTLLVRTPKAQAIGVNKNLTGLNKEYLRENGIKEGDNYGYFTYHLVIEIDLIRDRYKYVEIPHFLITGALIQALNNEFDIAHYNLEKSKVA